MNEQEDVIVAKRAGFCPGVKRAIDKVLELEASGHCPVYTIGPLIHNKQVTEMLAAKKISAIEKPREAKDKNGVLVFAPMALHRNFKKKWSPAAWKWWTPLVR